MMNQAFRRAREMAALIGGLMALADPIERRAALEGMPAYKSRGHGRGFVSPRFWKRGSNTGRNRSQEEARRRRQIDNGQLSPVYRSLSDATPFI